MSIKSFLLYLALIGVGLAGGIVTGIRIGSPSSAAKTPEISDTLNQSEKHPISTPDIAPTPNETSVDIAKSLAPSKKPAALLDQLTRILNESDENDKALEKADFLSQLDPQRFPEYLTLVRSLQKKSNRREATSMIVNQWAKTDPAAAWSYANSLMDLNTHDRLDATTHIFVAWGERSPQEAFIQAKKLPPGWLRHWATYGILRGMARNDPEKAIELAKRDFSSDVNQVQLVNLNWMYLAPKNPQQAASNLLQLPATGTTQNAINNVVYTWATQDPKAALQWVQKLPNGSLRNQNIAKAVSGWSEIDPEDASTFVLGLPNGELRNQAIEQVLLYQSIKLGLAGSNPESYITGSNPDFLKNFVDKLPEGPSKNRVVERMFDLSSSWDPNMSHWNTQAALQYVDEMTPGLMQTNAVAKVVSQWAVNDSTGALAYAQQLDGEMKRAATSSALSEWAHHDPKAALDYVTKPGNEVLQADAISSIASELAKANPQDALAVAEKFSEGPNRQNFLSSVISTWSQNDPVSAADYALHKLSGESQAKAITDVAWNWAGDDPQATAKWISGLSDNDSKTNATRNLIWQWTPNDSKSAGDYLKQLPVGPTRDAGLGAYSDKMVNTDPAAATQWANSISDDKGRDYYVEIAYRKWVATAPNDAKAFLENSAVSDELKSRLQQ